MDSIDEDFGELYADVQVQVKTITDNAPEFTKFYTEPEEDEKSNKNINSRSEENRVSRSTQEMVSLEADDGSDSEDELRIMLNDEDCERFPVTGGSSGGGGFNEDEDGFDQVVGDGLELNSNNDDRKNGHSYNSQQHSQYKYIRPHGSTFQSNSRVNGSIGIASFSTMPTEGDWKDNGCNQHKGLKSVVPQRAYGFWLPRYRTILDVNIDTFEEKPWNTFEEKPWNHSESNISDFFNFGFNEDGWKSYCSLLAYEVGFENEKIVREARAMHNNRVRCALKFSDWVERPWELPKGRAIEVEGSICERQPSMDVKVSTHAGFRCCDTAINGGFNEDEDGFNQVVGDGLELNSNNNDRNNGHSHNSQQHSQYKYIRPHG